MTQRRRARNRRRCWLRPVAMSRALWGMAHLSADSLEALQDRIGFRFRDPSLLELALTHRSFRPPGDAPRPASNGRLALLGDAVVEAILSFHLYVTHPDWSRGRLTRVRSAAVCRANLAAVGAELGLADLVLVGPGERRVGGKARPSLLAAAVEAICAAAYLETAAASAYSFASQAGTGRVMGAIMAQAATHPEVGEGIVWPGYEPLGIEDIASDASASPGADPPASGDLSALQSRLGLTFLDQSLLRQALTRASYLPKDAVAASLCNERLAFAGDAFLNLGVAVHLYLVHPEATVGRLTKLRIALMADRSLGRVARDCGLGDYLLMGPREEAVGGRKRPSVLAGALKALIAAAVLATLPDDSRLAIRGLVLRLLGPSLARFERDPGTDYKATLQDWVQREHRTVPIYRTVGESGSPHARVFTVAVRLKGKVLGTGSGHTRREADQKAARNALAKLRVGGSPP